MDGITSKDYSDPSFLPTKARCGKYTSPAASRSWRKDRENMTQPCGESQFLESGCDGKLFSSGPRPSVAEPGRASGSALAGIELGSNR